MSQTQSGKRRLCYCHPCATRCAETRATVLGELRTPAVQVMMALQRLLGRVELAGMGFGLGVTAETILAWRRQVALQVEASTHHRRQNLPVPQGQRDEMGHGIARRHASETATTGASVPDNEEGRPWGWISCAPALRWMSAAVMGPCTCDTAQEVVAATQTRVAGLPGCCSKGCTGALAAHRGLPRGDDVCTPRGKPHSTLVSAPWVTQMEPSTLLPWRTRVVRGPHT